MLRLYQAGPNFGREGISMPRISQDCRFDHGKTGSPPAISRGIEPLQTSGSADRMHGLRKRLIDLLPKTGPFDHLLRKQVEYTSSNPRSGGGKRGRAGEDGSAGRMGKIGSRQTGWKFWGVEVQ
jgi:hypothetical protein